MSISKQKERIYLQFERLTDNKSDRNTKITHENNGFINCHQNKRIKKRYIFSQFTNDDDEDEDGNDGSTHAMSDIRICLCFVMYLYCICIFVFVNGESE